MKKYRIIKKPIPIGSKTDSKRLASIEKRSESKYSKFEVSGCIDTDLAAINEIFKNCLDITIRRFELGAGKIPCFAVFLDSLIQKEFANDDFLKPIMSNSASADTDTGFDGAGMAGYLKSTLLYSFQVEEFNQLKDIVRKILSGYCALFIEGCKNVIAANTKGQTGRAVDRAQIEAVVRGPQEAFIEDLKTNISLLRKRLRTPDLKFELIELGRLSGTPVAISYIKGIADENTLKVVKKRVRRIDIDLILDSGYIEKLIEDDTYSPFPQMAVTERPDKSVAALAEGRIVIMIDGAPTVLVVPVTFTDFLIAAEDYYVKFYFSTLVRILRYFAFVIALLGPSLYIAITTFHQEMIPFPLLVTIARSRADIPFPAIIEALLMEFTFELLREAGIRLPQPVGPAVSIVGGLVIGQGVVQAGIVSQTMVIVVAVTGIASFAIPAFNYAITLRFIRFPFMILASIFGIFGITMGLMVLMIHMAGLRSVGVPYLSPFAPTSVQAVKDTVVLGPLWTLTKRPSYIQKNNINRMRKDLQPKPDDRNR